MIWRQRIVNLPTFLKDWTPFLSGVVTPLVIGIVGWQITKAIETSKLDAQYVQLAVSILTNDKPSQDQKREETLRKLAARMLKERSPVSLADAELSALEFGLKGLDFQGSLTMSPVTVRSEATVRGKLD